MAVQIYSVSAMGMTCTGHLLCGNPPQIIPLKLQFIKIGKHKKLLCCWRNIVLQTDECID